MRELGLGSTMVTIVVWPKSSDGKNTSPVRDAIQNSRQEALDAVSRANSLELIAQGEDCGFIQPYLY